MSWIALEYLCGTCHERIERFEDRAAIPTEIECSCGGHAERAISAVKGKVVWGSAASRGGREDPPHPGMMDTRPLADGMKRSEWKKKRREVHGNARYKQIRGNL